MNYQLFCCLALSVGCSFAAKGVALTSDQQKQRDSLWDMGEIRGHPLGPEKLSTRKAPLYVAGANDWMNTGDAWVAPKGNKALEAAAPKPGHSDEQLVVEEYYYSLEMTPQGPNRIFCAIARPEKASGPQPVILVFHGGGGHASGALALAIARKHSGMAALAMDYNG